MKSWVNGAVDKSTAMPRTAYGMARPPLVQALRLPVCAKSTNHRFLLPGDCSLRLFPYRDSLLRLTKLPPPSGYRTSTPSLQAARVSPLESTVHWIPAFLDTYLSFLHIPSPQGGQPNAAKVMQLRTLKTSKVLSQRTVWRLRAMLGLRVLSSLLTAV